MLVGTAALLAENRIETTALDSAAEELRREGHTVAFVAVDGKSAGLLGIADAIKPTSFEAIRELMRDGIRVAMVTGRQSHDRASRRAQTRAWRSFMPEVLPEQKSR